MRFVTRSNDEVWLFPSSAHGGSECSLKSAPLLRQDLSTLTSDVQSRGNMCTSSEDGWCPVQAARAPRIIHARHRAVLAEGYYLRGQ